MGSFSFLRVTSRTHDAAEGQRQREGAGAIPFRLKSRRFSPPLRPSVHRPLSHLSDPHGLVSRARNHPLFSTSTERTRALRDRTGREKFRGETIESDRRRAKRKESEHANGLRRSRRTKRKPAYGSSLQSPRAKSPALSADLGGLRLRSGPLCQHSSLVTREPPLPCAGFLFILDRDFKSNSYLIRKSILWEQRWIIAIEVYE